jgi:dolichol-phosphate mannosyltransferase
MPAFNEEEVLPHSLAEAVAVLSRLCGRWELVMVDDGSTDATPSILAEAARREPRIRVLTHPVNLGYSAALIHGFAACRLEAIFYTDADAQFDFEDLRHAWPMLSESDMVAGWRRDRQDSRLRRFASGVFNLLQSTVLGVRARDVDCAFKLFRRSYFERVRLSSQGFLIDSELFARASRAGLRVTQLPVTHRARKGGRSSIHPATIGRTLLHLWRLSRDLRREKGPAAADPDPLWASAPPRRPAP